MLSDYAPILLFAGICVALAALIVALVQLVGPRRSSAANAAQDLPYESGIMPVESARRRFSVSFYVTAMLFIVFDVETVFLFPWATIVRDLKLYGLLEIGVFVATLLLALGYVWGKGALRWEE